MICLLLHRIVANNLCSKFVAVIQLQLKHSIRSKCKALSNKGSQHLGMLSGLLQVSL